MTTMTDNSQPYCTESKVLQVHFLQPLCALPPNAFSLCDASFASGRSGIGQLQQLAHSRDGGALLPRHPPRAMMRLHLHLTLAPARVLLQRGPVRAAVEVVEHGLGGRKEVVAARVEPVIVTDQPE